MAATNNWKTHFILQEKLLTLLLHIKNLIIQIVCSHLVATGTLVVKMFNFICCVCDAQVQKRLF